MAQLNKLKKERGRIKGLVTRAEIAFTENQEMRVAEAQVRLKKLEDSWQDFQQVQGKIEDLAPEEADQLAEFEQHNEAERNQFERRYFAVAARAQTIIDSERMQVKTREDDVARGNNLQQPVVNGQDVRRVEKHNRPRLPEIKLPEFDGDWTKWLFFKNSFLTTVVEDQDLSRIQKHQYLISVLIGEALKVIEGFEINDQNFPIVWQILEDTYNNEMMIMESHLEQLLNFPSISKDYKAQSIKTIIWHIQTHLQSLKVLGQPVDQWDSIIIHLGKKKLDYAEQKEWQEKIKDKTPNDMPKLAEFIKFLTERCHTLRILKQNNENSSLSNTGSTARPVVKKDKRPKRKITLVATPAPCKNSEGDHHISKCDDFLRLNAIERKKRVIDKRLCLNCLKPGHLVRDCSSSTGRSCGAKHNTLLHEDHKKGVESKEAVTVNCCTETEKSEAHVAMYCVRKPSSQVILSTAQVNVYDAKNRKITCRALLDPGSQINLIASELMQKLDIPYIRQTRTVSGINQVQTSACRVINIDVESNDSSFKTELECLVLPSITENPGWKYA